LALCLGILAGTLSCQGTPPAAPPLTDDEQVLVDLYVRVAVLDSWRADAPDSVGPALDRLGAGADSAAVRRALAALRSEPRRWEWVLDAIVQRLHALEESPDPRAGLREALDGSP
jgi:hypothetical protein